MSGMWWLKTPALLCALPGGKRAAAAPWRRLLWRHGTPRRLQSSTLRDAIQDAAAQQPAGGYWSATLKYWSSTSAFLGRAVPEWPALHWDRFSTVISQPVNYMQLSMLNAINLVGANVPRLVGLLLAEMVRSNPW